MFGDEGVPAWQPYDGKQDYITLYPHESISAEQQVVDPTANWNLHSKEVIEKIDCRQAGILDEVNPPCIVKLSHGYAGLGNYFIRSEADADAMHAQVTQHWPDSTLVINEILEDITGDYGVQFYLRKDGGVIWLGFTEQHFDDDSRWCGGSFSAEIQNSMLPHFEPIIRSTANYLHSQNYFGVVGIDILRNAANEFFLVDVNPRLTGISPFLMASRIFARDGLTKGIYQASGSYAGNLKQLIAAAESCEEARVLVLSAYEDPDACQTVCHLSASSNSQDINRAAIREIVQT